MLKGFYETFTSQESRNITIALVERINEDIQLPAELVESVRRWDISPLLDYQVNYDSLSVPSALALRQVLAFFQKNADIGLAGDRRHNALTKFLESEESCKLVNRRIRNGSFHETPVDIGSVLYLAQCKIATILGSAPSLHELDFSFGPGSNTNVKKNTSARWKLSAVPACSSNMTSIVRDVLEECYQICNLWGNTTYCPVDQDLWAVPVEVWPATLMFVPKNAKTDRSIIIEPSLNTFVQKGIGNYMKKLLLRHGVDLRDQDLSKVSNRKRALRASIDGSLATIDLSSASDSIAKLLVRDLLPTDWFSLLDSCRSGHVVSKEFDLNLQLEKFSSMGNGFTFELESLLFFALACACCQYKGVASDVSVYGDDIILPVDVVPLLIEVFTWCGFSVNSEKSYWSGHFRESCGGDYLFGQSVRPYYQKSNWSYEHLFKLHNFLIRGGLNHMLPSLFEKVVDMIPPQIRNYGPDGFGDGHLIGDYRLSPHRRKDGWCGGLFNTRTKTPVDVIHGLLPGDYILPFYMAGKSQGERVNVFRVRGSKPRVKWVRVYTLR